MNEGLQLNWLRNQQVPPVWKSKSQTKHTLVAEGMRELIARSAPLSKLPPIRQLADQFGVTRVTLLRALRELSAEGLVVARRGAGCWVAPQKQTMSPSFGFVGPQTTELRCKVQSGLPHQMAYWKEAARAFAKVYPGSDIIFALMDGGAPPDVSDADLIEISTLQYPEVLESGCLLHEPGGKPAQSRVFFAPQQAHLGCAFYNPVLLEKIGALAPNYVDFEGQMRWLLDLQAKWKKATGNAKPCINTHESFLLLGERGRKALVDWLMGKDEALPRALDERLKRIHAMLSLTVTPKDHDEVMGTYVPMFNKGEIPVIFARTSGLRDVFHVNGFEPGYHPCFDTDDEISSVETGFVVRRDHGHAADALRFAEFLAKPEMQQLLPKHGMVPLQADLFTAGDAPSLWKKSRTTWFHTKEERSIWYSIIEPECSRWRRGETDIATFQTDCRHLARMTLFQG